MHLNEWIRLVLFCCVCLLVYFSIKIKTAPFASYIFALFIQQPLLPLPPPPPPKSTQLYCIIYTRVHQNSFRPKWTKRRSIITIFIYIFIEEDIEIKEKHNLFVFTCTVGLTIWTTNKKHFFFFLRSQ